MKYTLVYRERENGYNWSVRNQDGLYAAWIGKNTCRTHIRGWTTAGHASDYIDNHMQADCVWAPWPGDKPAAIKPVTTAASYKPTHSGYPEPEGTSKPRFVSQELDRMAAGWASMGTGRIPSSQPLVWPVIPQADDGSNEEPETIPDQVIVVALINEGSLGSLLRSKILFPNL